MAIDVYTNCPSQSGKKIKFCCGKDIVQDLEQIFQRTQSNQLQAALGIIDKSIETKGERDCLSVLKTSILISTMQLQEAKKCNDEFLARSPKNPVGLQHKVQIAAREGRAEEAIELFQDAMEAIEEVPPNCTPLTTRDVALTLARLDRIPAAIALVNFVDSLGDEMLNEGLATLFLEMQASPTVNLILKRSLQLDRPESIDDFDSQPWAKSYMNVLRLVDRAQFRRALKLLHRIDEKFPDVPCVVRAIPFVMLSYGNYEGLEDALQRRADAETSEHHDVLQTLVLKQQISQEDRVDFVMTEHKIHDADRLLEIMATHRHLELNPQGSGVEREGPPAKACYYIHDKELPLESDELSLEGLSEVLGVVEVFGRQTDREARIEILSSRWHLDQGALQPVYEALGETIEAEPLKSEVLSTSRLPDLLMSPQIRLPLNQGGFDSVTELEAEYMVNHLVNVFANEKFDFLGGKSFAELVQEDPKSDLVKATLLRIEFSLGSHISGTRITDSVYDHFKVEPMPSIPAEEITNETLLLTRFAELSELTQQKLAAMFMSSSMLGDSAAARKIAFEILGRDDEPAVPYPQLCLLAARSSSTFEEGLTHLNNVKNRLKSQGKPYGTILVAEFEYRISRGETENLDSLFERLRRHHMDEPDVETSLFKVLSKYNLLQGPPSEMAPEAAPDQVAAPKSRIIADPSQPTAAEPQKENSESGLWLPGQ